MFWGITKVPTQLSEMNHLPSQHLSAKQSISNLTRCPVDYSTLLAGLVQNLLFQRFILKPLSISFVFYSRQKYIFIYI